ncbi:MAG: hypothetical protein LBS62_12300 [Clostridiales bacterium]|nr:hypothetical protein [Clostridiales bacterium]
MEDTFFDLWSAVEERGEVRGRQAEKQAVAVNLLRNGMAVEFIASVTGLPKERITELAVGI